MHYNFFCNRGLSLANTRHPNNISIIITSREVDPPLAGFSARVPDTSDISEAGYFNSGDSDASKAHNRGLAHIQNIIVFQNAFMQSSSGEAHGQTGHK